MGWLHVRQELVIGNFLKKKKKKLHFPIVFDKTLFGPFSFHLFLVYCEFFVSFFLINLCPLLGLYLVHLCALILAHMEHYHVRKELVFYKQY